MLFSGVGYRDRRHNPWSEACIQNLNFNVNGTHPSSAMMIGCVIISVLKQEGGTVGYGTQSDIMIRVLQKTEATVDGGNSKE